MNNGLEGKTPEQQEELKIMYIFNLIKDKVVENLNSENVSEKQYSLEDIINITAEEEVTKEYLSQISEKLEEKFKNQVVKMSISTTEQGEPVWIFVGNPE